MDASGTFINGYDPKMSQQARKRPPKLFHKKSRNGCQRCRTRRVKCNEGKPACGACERHGLSCEYVTAATRSRSSESPVAVSASKSSDHATQVIAVSRLEASSRVEVGLTEVIEPPESSDRRKTELRLQHQYITNTGRSIGIDDTSRMIWTEKIPALAFHSDALMYAMHTMASMHLARENESNSTFPASWSELSGRYLNMCIREHNRDISQLSETNVDAVCMTANVLRITAFVMLQDRQIQPYTPPQAWLQLTTAMGEIYRKARDYFKEGGTYITVQLIKTSPIVLDPRLRSGGFRLARMQHLLRRSDNDKATEPWDQEVEEAYNSTLSYIGGLLVAIEKGVAPGEILRRLVIFPMLIDTRFAALVTSQEPRALVILAHYFGLLHRFGRDFWWIQNVGRRETQAILSFLQPEWHDLLIVPRELVEGGMDD